MRSSVTPTDGAPLQAVLQRTASAVAEHYPEAVGALVFGSQVAGDADSASDTDVIVLFESLEYDFHELRGQRPVLLDAHGTTVAGLRAHLAVQARMNACFFAKALCEGHVIDDSRDLWPALIQQARAIYDNPRAPPDWSGVRANLTSRLNDLGRQWRPMERALIASEIAKYLFGIWSVQHRGWTARMDVARKWLDADAPGLARELEQAFAEALEGETGKLEALADLALARIGGRLGPNERIRVRAAA